MKGKARGVIVSLLLSAACLLQLSVVAHGNSSGAVEGQTQHPASDGAGTVTFVVEDEQGVPLEGASVFLDGGEQLTNAEGEAVFEGPFETQEMSYLVTKILHTPAFGSLTAAPGEHTSEEVVLQRSVTLDLPLGDEYQPHSTVEIVLANQGTVGLRLGPPYHTFPFTVERYTDGSWEQVPLAIEVLTVVVELDPGEAHEAAFVPEEHFAAGDVVPGRYRVLGEVASLQDGGTEGVLSAEFTLVVEEGEVELEIDVSGEGAVEPHGEGTHAFNVGTEISLEAVPAAGQAFTGWELEGSAQDVCDWWAPNCTFTIDRDTLAVAHFAPEEEVVTLTLASTEGGEVTEPGEGNLPYLEGTEVQLVAEPAPGHIFESWAGDTAHVADPALAMTSVTVHEAIHIEAQFAPANGEGHAYGADAGWYLVSVPTSGDTADIFDAVLYRWDAAAGEYATPTALDPGEGYWAHLPEGHHVTVAGTIPQGEVTVELGHAGWHQLSAPWHYPRGAIRVSRGGEEKSWSAAAAAGWVRETIYGYAPGDGEFTMPETLHPWYGYWVRAYVEGLTVRLAHEDATAATAGLELGMATALPPLDLPPLPGPEGRSAPLSVASHPSPVYGDTALFRVTGPIAGRVEYIRVTVMDLGGRRVWQGSTGGAELSWHTDGVANGTYLYQAEVKLLGEWVSAGTERLLILR